MFLAWAWPSVPGARPVFKINIKDLRVGYLRVDISMMVMLCAMLVMLWDMIDEVQS